MRASTTSIIIITSLAMSSSSTPFFFALGAPVPSSGNVPSPPPFPYKPKPYVNTDTSGGHRKAIIEGAKFNLEHLIEDVKDGYIFPALIDEDLQKEKSALASDAAEIKATATAPSAAGGSPVPTRMAADGAEAKSVIDTLQSALDELARLQTMRRRGATPENSLPIASNGHVAPALLAQDDAAAPIISIIASTPPAAPTSSAPVKFAASAPAPAPAVFTAVAEGGAPASSLSPATKVFLSMASVIPFDEDTAPPLLRSAVLSPSASAQPSATLA